MSDDFSECMCSEYGLGDYPGCPECYTVGGDYIDPRPELGPPDPRCVYCRRFACVCPF